MIGNTFQSLFLVGANELASHGVEYGPEQQSAGFNKEEWDLLQKETCWTKAEQRKIPSALTNAVSVTLQTAGLPPIQLPGAYIAACICKLVNPCNRLVACISAPESFDALSASGITGPSEIKITTKQQMMGLVTYFSSAEFGALESFMLDAETQRLVLEEQTNNA